MIRILALVFFCLCLPAMAFSRGLTYELRITEPHTHYAEVEMTIPDVSDSVDVIMPVWIPGSYYLREYAQHVEQFAAFTGKQSEVMSRKIRKNIWRVYCPGYSGDITVTYQVYAYELTVRTSFINMHQAYINGVSMFMYTNRYRDEPIELRLVYPERWSEVVTTLVQKDAKIDDVYTAKNYDELADRPIAIGDPQSFTFEYELIPHDVAVFGEAELDVPRMQDDMYQVVEECTGIFGNNPLNNYLFMVHVFPGGRGGLEHFNCTSVLASPSSFVSESAYKRFLSLISHEYFHLWLVKRIKPTVLKRYDYENEQYTSLLWLFEGFTSYYDDLVLMRGNIYSESEYYDIVESNIERTVNQPGNTIQPVAEASFDAWIKFYRPNENRHNSTVSYYTKGSVIANMMDLIIIHETKGKRSLDDVMKLLYEKYQHEPDFGITEENVQQLFLSATGVNMDWFFRDHIYGTEPIAYEKYLAYAGIEAMRTDGHRRQHGFTGARFEKKNNSYEVTRVDRNSPAWRAGLNVGDEVEELNGEPADDLPSLLDNLHPGDEAAFIVERMGQQYIIEMTTTEDPAISLELQPFEKPSAAQKKVHEIWMGRKVVID